MYFDPIMHQSAVNDQFATFTMGRAYYGQLIADVHAHLSNMGRSLSFGLRLHLHPFFYCIICTDALENIRRFDDKFPNSV